MPLRRRMWAGVLVAAVLVAAGLVWSWLPRADHGEARVPVIAVEVPAEPAVREPTPALPSKLDTDPRSVDGDAKRRRADALRAGILVAAQAREGTDEGAEPAAPEAAAAVRGSLRDRIGGRDELAAALNEDFMPLADECIQQARERTPSLEGMLALEVAVIADADLGAVIETVDYPDRNEVAEAGLLECIRETALSTTLPSPGEHGREEFLLTLNVGE